MEAQLFDFLGKVISGALGIMDQLYTGVPVAKDAILWMIFVILVMNLFVLPIRGIGSSDRARASKALNKRGKDDG